MSSIDILLMALTNLWRRKLRTFLTVLGVFIGTTSVVIMVSLGNGLREQNHEMLKGMGDLTIVEVYPNEIGGNMSGNQNQSKKLKLNDKAIEEFRKIRGVQAVMPMLRLSQSYLSTGRYICYSNVIGMSAGDLEAFGYKLRDGRSFTSGDKNAAIYGSEVASNFVNFKSQRYDPMKDTDLSKKKIILKTGDPYGEKKDNPFDQNPKKVKLPEFELKYIGTLEDGQGEMNYSVILPSDFLKKIQVEIDKANNEKNNAKNSKVYNQVRVKCKDINEVTPVENEIKSLGFNTSTMKSMLDEMNKSTNTIQAIFGGIGAVSLLVAAVGIANTMVMSIYERTKEIGVMKVIGASIRDIKRLFLLEAGLIGFLGGAIGSLLSIIFSYLLNRSFASKMGASRISIIPLWQILAAIFFSTLVGLLSGYLPARRAMKLSALEAIRTE